MVDYVVTVYAPLGNSDFFEQWSAIIHTAEQVKERIASQMDEDLKCSRADFVVINDGRSLLPQLENLLKALKNGKGGRDACVCRM